MFSKKYILICFALLPLLSYLVWIPRHPLLTHPYWCGAPAPLIVLFCTLMIPALLGFCYSFITWLDDPPKGWLEWPRYFIVLMLFFCFATMWSVSVYNEWHVCVSIALIGSAVTSILLLVGALNEPTIRPGVVMGFTALCVVTVIMDAIVWQSIYFRRTR